MESAGQLRVEKHRRSDCPVFTLPDPLFLSPSRRENVIYVQALAGIIPSLPHSTQESTIMKHIPRHVRLPRHTRHWCLQYRRSEASASTPLTLAGPKCSRAYKSIFDKRWRSPKATVFDPDSAKFPAQTPPTRRSAACCMQYPSISLSHAL